MEDILRSIENNNGNCIQLMNEKLQKLAKRGYITPFEILSLEAEYLGFFYDAIGIELHPERAKNDHRYWLFPNQNDITIDEIYEIIGSKELLNGSI